MYKRCVSEQSAKRQREMESGLLDALASVRYEDITISSLCEKLNVPRKTFYRYFSSKDGALFALIDHTLMDFIHSFHSYNDTETLSLLESFFLFWKQHKALLDVLDKNKLHSLLIKRIVALASTDSEFTIEIFPVSENVAREYVVIYLISGLMSMVIHWHHSGFKQSANQMALIAANTTSPTFMAGASLKMQRL